MKASRKAILALIGAMAIGATMAAPSVEIVSVQQQYPWTNTVDIVYNVAGVASDTNGYFVAFTPTTQDGLPIKDVNGETSIQVALSCTTNGAVAQWFPQTNQQYTACKMTPAVFRGGSGGGNDYMIVDLETGAVTYEPMATQEASNEKYQADQYKTRYLVLRRIPADKYTIGYSEVKANLPHQTTIAKDYYISIYHLTVAQYDRVVNGSSSVSKYPVGGSSTPAKYVGVNWNTIRGSALAGAIPSGTCFFGKLNAKTGKIGFDIPTHAMYEVAARAGGTSKWGICETEAELTEYAWVGESAMHEVGLKKANKWGIYDAWGNAWEQTRDVAPNPFTLTASNQADGLKPITTGTTSSRIQISHGYNTTASISLSNVSAHGATATDAITFRVAYVEP